MQQIDVSASPAQLSRLRNGHRVRVHHGAIRGEGIVLLVDPAKFSQMTRSFARGQAATISLSPEEVQANQESAEELGGSGLFAGGSVSKKLKKGFNKAGKSIVKAEAAVRASPFGRTVVKTVLPLAAKLAVQAAAQRAGMDPASSKELGNAGSKITTSGLTEAGYGMTGAGKKSLMRRIGRKQIRSVTKELGRAAKAVIRDVLLPVGKERLREELSTVGRKQDASPVMAYPLDYGYEKPYADYGRDDYGYDWNDYGYDSYGGYGLYASGRGLYAAGRGGFNGPPSRLPATSSTMGSVGVSGSILSAADHPALASDPSGANLLMNTGLPPRFQKGGYHFV
jgi:hypothetical protein